MMPVGYYIDPARLRMLAVIDPNTRVIRPLLAPTESSQVQSSGQAHWQYLGYTMRQFTPRYVACRVTTIGAGTQTAEIGLFSSPTEPRKAAQTLTCLVATDTVDALTGTGIKRNTSAFATVISAGVHLWAGIRIAMATTQPAIRLTTADWSQGYCMFKAGCAAFAAGTTYASNSVNDTAQLMDLRVERD